MFKTIEKAISNEIVEKKSRFITNIFYIESKEEAEEKLLEIRKKYYDAKHNCFAYRVYEENKIYERFSDDGEPSGTAGSPMINILKSNNLCNILVVITRYFGGVLLRNRRIS
ncbi:MAG: YigZ family protein [Clostridia bacterium]|nr:YigZ family protein [Clostridia bacterium]